MNDVSFRLTPTDIRRQPFRRSLFGFDRASVEEFRDQVAAELERLLRERAAMEERLANFRDQLKGFQEREKSINDAVMMAQQIRTEAEESTRRQSEIAVVEARRRADEMLTGAREAEAEVRRDLEEAQRQFAAYVSALRQLLWRQLAELDALEEHERDGTPPRRRDSSAE